MTLAQEAEIKLIKYEGLNDDDTSVMQISSITQSEVIANQKQKSQLGNTQNVNYGQNVTAPRPNWIANLTCL